MKTATCIIAITLSGASLFAQRSITIPQYATIFEAPAERPDALVKIFSNLGPSTNAYLPGGYYVLGPNNSLQPGTNQFLGLPFKPAQSSHAQALQAAVSWCSTACSGITSAGANQVNLSLYADNGSGLPGTLLAGPVTVKNLPTFGTCCTIAKASIPSTALTAGTQYWIVADTPASGTGSNSVDVWNSIPQLLGGVNVGGSWFQNQNNLMPAGGVFGTIP